MPREGPIVPWPVTKFKTGEGFEKIKDPIIAEASVRIWLNGNEIVAILSLKQQLEELAVGFLYNECLIVEPSKITKVEVNDRADTVMVESDEKLRESVLTTIRSITSGCGKGISYINPLKMEHFEKIKPTVKIKASTINKLMNEFIRISELFKLTGGSHTAAWSDGASIFQVSEDIGRHNCIDKLVGGRILHPDESEGSFMILSSGRISSDIASKSIRGGAEILVSRSAPTSGAAQLAAEFGMTMIGFARGGRFNIYTHPERIIE
jgi:FdhD protein